MTRPGAVKRPQLQLPNVAPARTLPFAWSQQTRGQMADEIAQDRGRCAIP
jgi:hypothetical protein